MQGITDVLKDDGDLLPAPWSSIKASLTERYDYILVFASDTGAHPTAPANQYRRSSMASCYNSA
jgi:hypothetical protein